MELVRQTGRKCLLVADCTRWVDLWPTSFIGTRFGWRKRCAILSWLAAPSSIPLYHDLWLDPPFFLKTYSLQDWSEHARSSKLDSNWKYTMRIFFDIWSRIMSKQLLTCILHTWLLNEIGSRAVGKGTSLKAEMRGPFDTFVSLFNMHVGEGKKPICIFHFKSTVRYGLWCNRSHVSVIIPSMANPLHSGSGSLCSLDKSSAECMKIRPYLVTHRSARHRRLFLCHLTEMMRRAEATTHDVTKEMISLALSFFIYYIYFSPPPFLYDQLIEWEDAFMLGWGLDRAQHYHNTSPFNSVSDF